MSRRRRIQFPGAIYHVMSRGNRKGAIFESDQDRKSLIETIAEGLTRYAARCFALCLMGNHYHLVLDTPRGNLSDTMRFINGVYAQRMNRRHARTGHLFEGRFRSIVVQREGYLRRVCRYVVRNPIRAGLCVELGEWEWSTHRATAGLEAAPEWLYLDWLEGAFSPLPNASAREQYVRFVNHPVERKSMYRTAVGDAAFEAAVKEAARQNWPDRPLPRSIAALGRPTLDVIFGTHRAAGRGRDAAIEIAHVAHGYRLSEIARFLRVNRSVMTRAVRRQRPAVTTWGSTPA